MSNNADVSDLSWGKDTFMSFCSFHSAKVKRKCSRYQYLFKAAPMWYVGFSRRPLRSRCLINPEETKISYTQTSSHNPGVRRFRGHIKPDFRSARLEKNIFRSFFPDFVHQAQTAEEKTDGGQRHGTAARVWISACRCSTGSTLLTTSYQNQALDPPRLKLVCQFHEEVMTDKEWKTVFKTNFITSTKWSKIMVGSKEKLSKRLQQGRIQDQENKLVMVLKLWVIQLQSCVGIEVKLFSFKINTVQRGKVTRSPNIKKTEPF